MIKILLHEEFYANLFSQDDIDLEVQGNLLSNVSRSLSESESESCDGDLSLFEITNAVKGMSKNKSPGPDGLTVEFYCYFWNTIRPILVEDRVLCESMKTSNTRLVYKKGDKRNLKNWRRFLC